MISTLSAEVAGLPWGTIGHLLGVAALAVLAAVIGG